MLCWTRSQRYEGNADWNIIKQVKEAVSIPVIGNGDIKTVYDARRMIEETNCDFDGKVESPIVFYNGTLLSNKNGEEVKVDVEEAKLRCVREKLIQELRNIRDYCLLANEEEVQKVRYELNSQTVSKVLK